LIQSSRRNWHLNTCLVPHSSRFSSRKGVELPRRRIVDHDRILSNCSKDRLRRNPNWCDVKWPISMHCEVWREDDRWQAGNTNHWSICETKADAESPWLPITRT
jgi:hypothetical protein